jgi:hypothetical protein
VATTYITLQLIKFFLAMRFHSQSHFACPVMPDRASSYSFDNDRALGQLNPRCDVAKSACREHFESSSAHSFAVPFPKSAFRYCKVLARITFESKADRDTVGVCTDCQLLICSCCCSSSVEQRFLPRRLSTVAALCSINNLRI